MQARTTRAEALLSDVREDVVDFGDNFDGSEVEPQVLPAKLPMLLLNGATGIAVGMATNCPPHNLGEIVDALRALLEDRDLSDERLLELVPAPDFPTGGIVMGKGGAKDMYTTGRGSITIRAAAHVEPPSRAGGARGGGGDGAPVRRGQDGDAGAGGEHGEREEAGGHRRDSRRVVDGGPPHCLRGAARRGAPRRPQQYVQALEPPAHLRRQPDGGDRRRAAAEQLTLRAALLAFLDFRVESLLRRSRFRLRKAEERLHLVDGLLIAQGRMDEVVQTVRDAANVAEARAALESDAFGLSAEQAEAILSMQLRRLTALERETLQKEGDDLRARVAELNSIIDERPKLLELISEELGGLKEKYGTPRRTQIGTSADAELTDIDLMANEQCIIIRTIRGYMKRLPLDEFEAQQRGTRGKAGMTNMRDGDAVSRSSTATRTTTILCLSASGVAYALPAYKVPSTSRAPRAASSRTSCSPSPSEETHRDRPAGEQAFPTTSTCAAHAQRLDQEDRPPRLREDHRARPHRRLAAGGRRARPRERCAPTTRCSSARARTGGPVRHVRGGARASGRQSRGVKSMAMNAGDCIADMFVCRRVQPMATTTRNLAVAAARGGDALRVRQAHAREQLPPPAARRQGRHRHQVQARRRRLPSRCHRSRSRRRRRRTTRTARRASRWRSTSSC